MIAAATHLSVDQHQKRQRRERLAGALVLLACAAAAAVSIVLLTGPLPLVAGSVALLGAGAILLRPRIGLYLLLFCAVFLEQWGITGLDPLTARLPFYQTLAGAGIFPIPLSPVEMILLVTLGALFLRHVTARNDGSKFLRGPLFVQLLLFLLFVVGSIVFGLARGGGAGPFDLRAAWEETRAFFYLGITYVLACNLLQTWAHLRLFIWLFIAAVGIKSVQGLVRYAEVRANGLQLDAITGHEDVVFFSAFVVLLAGLLFFGGKLEGEVRRQMRVMLLVLPPLVFTLLVTNRRIGFLVLAAGLALVALLLLRTRRDLFMRIAPVALVALGLYTIIFWNGTGALSQPIRAVRSIVAPSTERDRSSNQWRELENYNINFNIRSAPVTGLGFGRPYYFAVAQPPLDASGFIYWRYIAHNAIYWIWMKMGVVGFILFWNLIGSAIILGILTFRQLQDGYLRALALFVAGAVLSQVIFSYGDLGLTYARSMIFLGCMLGLLARLPAFEEQADPANSRLATRRLGPSWSTAPSWALMGPR